MKITKKQLKQLIQEQIIKKNLMLNEQWDVSYELNDPEFPESNEKAYIGKSFVIKNTVKIKKITGNIADLSWAGREKGAPESRITIFLDNNDVIKCKMNAYKNYDTIEIISNPANFTNLSTSRFRRVDKIDVAAEYQSNDNTIIGSIMKYYIHIMENKQ